MWDGSCRLMQWSSDVTNRGSSPFGLHQHYVALCTLVFQMKNKPCIKETKTLKMTHAEASCEDFSLVSVCSFFTCCLAGKHKKKSMKKRDVHYHFMEKHADRNISFLGIEWMKCLVRVFSLFSLISSNFGSYLISASSTLAKWFHSAHIIKILTCQSSVLG